MQPPSAELSEELQAGWMGWGESRRCIAVMVMVVMRCRCKCKVMIDDKHDAAWQRIQARLTR